MNVIEFFDYELHSRAELALISHAFFLTVSTAIAQFIVYILFTINKDGDFILGGVK